ncbi:hypothetical protein MKY29_12060 [Psychrobacillus sp. FSL K6-2365]|uniref:hypothetical protein n=1 Tax=Psychrobacillus sp. FSL K6-2365 TaxID=2921546 RepID=UPI0030FB5C4C
MKHIKRIMVALLTFILATALMLSAFATFPNMNDITVYIVIGIYLVVSQIGFDLAKQKG